MISDREAKMPSNDLARLIAAEAIISKLHFHTTVHVVLTMVLFWMTYLFLDNTPSFTESAHVYDFMKSIMDEKYWGDLTLAVALAGAFTANARSWKVRTTGAGILSFAHAGLALCFILGKADVPSVGLLAASAVLGAALSYSTAYIGKRFESRVATSSS